MCALPLSIVWFVFSSRRRHTRCALVTGVQTCALPIYPPSAQGLRPADARLRGAARPARARVADQGRQAWPRRRRQHAAGGAARAVQCVRRHGERADVLGGVEAGGGRGAGGGGGLAGILGSRFSEGPKPFSSLREKVARRDG